MLGLVLVLVTALSSSARATTLVAAVPATDDAAPSPTDECAELPQRRARRSRRRCSRGRGQALARCHSRRARSVRADPASGHPGRARRRRLGQPAARRLDPVRRISWMSTEPSSGRDLRPEAAGRRAWPAHPCLPRGRSGRRARFATRGATPRRPACVRVPTRTSSVRGLPRRRPPRRPRPAHAGLAPATLARQLLVPFAQSVRCPAPSRGVRCHRRIRPSFARRSPPAGRRHRAAAGRGSHRSRRTSATSLPPVGAPGPRLPPHRRRATRAPGSRVAGSRLLAAAPRGHGGARCLDRRPTGLRAPLARTDLTARVSSYLPAPRPRTVDGRCSSWRHAQRPLCSILAVVDASGSMDFATAGGSRMQLLADAARIGLSFLPDHARVGLWIFSIDKGGAGPGLARCSSPYVASTSSSVGRTQRSRPAGAQAERLSSAHRLRRPVSTTPPLAAYRQALRNYRPRYSNSVVLMTDGQQRGPRLDHPRPARLQGSRSCATPSVRSASWASRSATTPTSVPCSG